MQIQENISLKKYNTFGMDVLARYFYAFSTVDQMQEIGASDTFKHYPVLVLGGGSNMLLTTNFEGLVIKNEIPDIELITEDDEYYFVKVGAGGDWPEFVLYCLEKSYAGVENLALIPGKVGASPMQNIGAYGVEMKDVFHSLEAIHIYDLNLVTFYNADCELGYRESIFKNKFKNQFVITSVTFRLNKVPVYKTAYGAIEDALQEMKVDTLSIQNIAQAVMRIRNSKLPNPTVLGNAGSFFKNPEIDAVQFDSLKNYYPNISGYKTEGGKIKIAAGWLIEQAGWKGFRQGDAGCHDKQALVLVNHGKATGTEIFELSEKIISSVHDKFGIFLHREVNIY